MIQFLRDLWTESPHIVVTLVVVALAFASSAVWLIRNWHADGPTDLWRDDDEWPYPPDFPDSD